MSSRFLAAMNYPFQEKCIGVARLNKLAKQLGEFRGAHIGNRVVPLAGQVDDVSAKDTVVDGEALLAALHLGIRREHDDAAHTARDRLVDRKLVKRLPPGIA